MIPWHMIGTALTACERAYKPEWGDVVYEDRKTSASAIVRKIDGYLVVAFKGSQELTDWLINMQALPPLMYQGQWVHRGFRKQHKSIWLQIRNHLIQQAACPLIVTGHSLGGALAELSCLFLHDYPGDVSLITFGKPNVFVKPQSARFDYLQEQISVVSGSDIVARIPRYCYAPDQGQKMLYLANDGQPHFIPQMTPAFRRFIRSDWSIRDAGSDHRLPLSYRRQLDPFLVAPHSNPRGTTNGS